MKTLKTRSLIASIALAAISAAALGLLVGSAEALAGFGVVASLAVLGVMELQGGATPRSLGPRPKDSIRLYRQTKSEEA
jgi:hypothetical protein